MKLSIKDRLLIPSLFPPKGSLIDQTLAKDIQGKTELSQEEMKKANLKTLPSGNLTWEDKGPEKEVEFSTTEIDFLKKQVERLDKEQSVTRDIVDLCLKIRG